MHKNILDLCYASNGAFHWHEVYYEMPIYLRLFYINQLSEIKEKEQEAMDSARKGSGKTPGSIPKGLRGKSGKLSSKTSVPRFSGPKTKK